MDEAVKKILKYQFPAVLWGLFILVGSSLPRVQQPLPLIPHLDKAVHFLEYGVFAYLITRALYYSVSQPGMMAALFLALIFSAVFGSADEIHQLFIPGRTNSMTDFLADLAGIILALFVFYTRHSRSSSIVSGIKDISQ